MNNSIINTSSNAYALQDIFSDKRVGNPSGNKEDIQALQNIMQRNLPSAVKAFFQTLWECIAHLKSWNESKLTVALNNANIGDKVTIWDTMVNNLSHFNPESQEKLSDFVKKTMLANCEEISQNPQFQEQAINVARKLSIPGFTAELRVACTNPGLYETMQDPEVTQILWKRDDIYLLRECNNNKEICEATLKCITADLFNELDDVTDESNKPEGSTKENSAFAAFYENFRGTQFGKDCILRDNLPEMQFGEQIWTWKDVKEEDTEGAQQWNEKQRTKRLLKTILEFCSNNSQKAADFFKKFLQQQHCSNNCMSTFGEVLAKHFEMNGANNGGVLAQLICPLIGTHNFQGFLKVDEDLNMYCSLFATREHSMDDETLKERRQTEINDLSPTNKALLKVDPLSPKFFSTFAFESVTSLRDDVHLDEKDVGQDVKASVYFNVGEAKKPISEQVPQIQNLNTLA